MALLLDMDFPANEVLSALVAHDWDGEACIEALGAPTGSAPPHGPDGADKPSQASASSATAAPPTGPSAAAASSACAAPSPRKPSAPDVSYLPPLIEPVGAEAEVGYLVHRCRPPEVPGLYLVSWPELEERLNVPRGRLAGRLNHYGVSLKKVTVRDAREWWGQDRPGAPLAVFR